ncbi:exonuclease SbcCD subunit D [Companilactobacillus ginsenosidimutans]|uniref:Nuclease SbcCD subunit D n=1 Tax=Companilactobacillus ginsenosidimutans TaxID=1007676 RepID=A0A0H4QK01_9LACO|nr:exonuclease SbcCD subunit D [Companilactobacillus ginsenosidimutans]AKP67386.1 exonuclease [Companilactobacillus ginsenosidimutans]
MKLLHTADWHIGRTLNGYSLLNEQKHAFKQILQLAKDEKVDGIVIAGDIYDRSIPGTDAVTTLDSMLREINLTNKIPIYAISGNHDGAKRLNYGREWMEFTNFHLNTLLDEAFTPLETEDTQIFMLPFFDPMDARVYYKEQGMDEDDVKNIHTINDAMELVLADMYKLFAPNKKHLLITHFSVTPSADQEIELTSETSSKVGGLATLTASQFDKFDYVMLGHIHTRFASPSENIRYSGSPIKFNVKEARLKNKGKGVDIVNITPDKITTEFHEIRPQTDLIVLEETWETLLDPTFYKTQPTKSDWFAITVKNFDRSKHINVRAQLQEIYGTVVELDYENLRKDTTAKIADKNISELSPDSIVEQFFQSVTGNDLSKEQKRLVDSIFVDLRKED